MKNSPFSVKRPASVNSDEIREAATQPSSNFKEKKVGMTFNMPKDWHREFKVTAVSRGLDMHELLEQCFEAWKKTHG